MYYLNLATNQCVWLPGLTWIESSLYSAQVTSSSLTQFIEHLLSAGHKRSSFSTNQSRERQLLLYESEQGRLQVDGSLSTNTPGGRFLVHEARKSEHLGQGLTSEHQGKDLRALAWWIGGARGRLFPAALARNRRSSRVTASTTPCPSALVVVTPAPARRRRRSSSSSGEERR